MVEYRQMLNIKNNNFAIEEKGISRVKAVRLKLKSVKDDIKPSLPLCAMDAVGYIKKKDLF